MSVVEIKIVHFSSKIVSSKIILTIEYYGKVDYSGVEETTKKTVSDLFFPLYSIMHCKSDLLPPEILTSPKKLASGDQISYIIENRMSYL